jgi:hypothetical protein
MIARAWSHISMTRAFWSSLRSSADKAHQGLALLPLSLLPLGGRVAAPLDLNHQPKVSRLGSITRKDLIVDGTKGEQAILVTPFRLDPTRRSQPSRFEFVILTFHFGSRFGVAISSHPEGISSH